MSVWICCCCFFFHFIFLLRNTQPFNHSTKQATSQPSIHPASQPAIYPSIFLLLLFKPQSTNSIQMYDSRLIITKKNKNDFFWKISIEITNKKFIIYCIRSYFLFFSKSTFYCCGLLWTSRFFFFFFVNSFTKFYFILLKYYLKYSFVFVFFFFHFIGMCSTLCFPYNNTEKEFTLGSHWYVFHYQKLYAFQWSLTMSHK